MLLCYKTCYVIVCIYTAALLGQLCCAEMLVGHSWIGTNAAALLVGLGAWGVCRCGVYGSLPR